MKRSFAFAAMAAVVVLMLAAVLAMFAPKQAEAGTTNPASWVVWNGATSFTSTQTSAAKYIANYEYVDYFAYLDVTPPAIGVTITLKTQFSPNNVDWYDTITVWNAVSVDTTTTPTRANAVGAYMRFVATASTTATFTPTVRILLK